jgi:hypothetical protein
MGYDYQREWIDKFTYQAPDPAKVPRFERTRAACKAAAEVLVRECPPGADLTAALRHLHEGMMTATKAIVFDPNPRPLPKTYWHVQSTGQLLYLRDHPEGDGSTVIGTIDPDGEGGWIVNINTPGVERGFATIEEAKASAEAKAEAKAKAKAAP